MKKVDLTVKVEEARWSEIFKNEKMTALGHLGTHFDVMNKTFSLENTVCNGKLIDVCAVGDRDIEIEDIGTVKIQANDFVIFHTGFLKRVRYGTQEYFKEHPQLSMRLIDYLIAQKVSLIGIDAAGIRRGEEHTKTDQYCADRGVFVIENIAHLEDLPGDAQHHPFTVYTFPVNFEGMTGLPCRVVAEF